MSDQGLETRFDPGFGRFLSWDLDLLGGYQSGFLETYVGARSDSFWWLRLKPGFAHELRHMGAHVLWVQGWQVAAYWQAIFAARGAGTQVWLRGETNARSSRNRIGKGVKRAVLRRLLSRIDRMLYIGEGNRQFYLEQGIDERQLAPAPYCVDNRRFAAAAAAVRNARGRIREEWRIPAEAFCFLFAGKFMAKKRPLDLIEAAGHLQDALPSRKIHLLWVGTGELGGQLRQACHTSFDVEAGAFNPASRQNAPNASFIGFLNQSEISRAYVAADCLVLPSDDNETWGLVVNEAMASGLPCIASNGCGCVEDLIQPIRPDLCYQIGNIVALEHCMAAAIANPPPPELLFTHISRYDITQTIDTVESLYLEAARRV